MHGGKCTGRFFQRNSVLKNMVHRAGVLICVKYNSNRYLLGKKLANQCFPPLNSMTKNRQMLKRMRLGANDVTSSVIARPTLAPIRT